MINFPLWNNYNTFILEVSSSSWQGGRWVGLVLRVSLGSRFSVQTTFPLSSLLSNGSTNTESLLIFQWDLFCTEQQRSASFSPPQFTAAAGRSSSSVSSSSSMIMSSGGRDSHTACASHTVIILYLQSENRLFFSSYQGHLSFIIYLYLTFKITWYSSCVAQDKKAATICDFWLCQTDIL